MAADDRRTKALATVVMPRPARELADAEPPPAASARRYLREHLPSIYTDPPGADPGVEGFTSRLIGSLERVLDPVVATLDCLPAQLSADTAPAPMLALMAGWLGLAEDERRSLADRRDEVRFASAIAQSRGTLPGIQLGLKTAFPSLPLRVEDGGGVTFSTDPAKEPAAGPREFVVYCDTPIPVERQAAVARAVDRLKPVNARYRLRVKSPPKPKQAPEPKPTVESEPPPAEDT
ncbi:MAG TPA: phage tail protein [Gaiellales bacterium]|nr:phage tail protein [Gaiellales bacterium]